MSELTYVSNAVNELDQDTLSDILQVSRRNNRRLHITGMLIYDGCGTFLSVLEGDNSLVENLYRTIQNEHRHRKVTLLSKR